MNYYPFHLGDYLSHTAHLDPLEDIAYRRLLDAYYLSEAPLRGRPEQLARLIRMRDHTDVVAQVLQEFFAQEDGEVWRHARCDDELDRMRAKQLKARASALASVAARMGNAEPKHSERSANAQRPLNEGSATNTNTNTNTKEKKKTRAGALPPPPDVDAQTWDDWLALRAKKRAPVTATVIDGARKEADKAGMAFGDFLAVWCTRGSQGLQADWLRPDERRFTRAESFRERDERAARERWEAMTGRKWPGGTAEVIDITPPPLEIQ